MPGLHFFMLHIKNVRQPPDCVAERSLKLSKQTQLHADQKKKKKGKLLWQADLINVVLNTHFHFTQIRPPIAVAQPGGAGGV